LNFSFGRTVPLFLRANILTRPPARIFCIPRAYVEIDHQISVRRLNNNNATISSDDKHRGNIRTVFYNFEISDRVETVRDNEIHDDDVLKTTQRRTDGPFLRRIKLRCRDICCFFFFFVVASLYI